MSTVKMSQAGLLGAVRDVLGPAMEKAASVLARRVKGKLGVSAQGQGSRTARTAAGKAAAKRKGQASAPGQPPRRRSGELRNSINYVVENENGEVRAKVGSGLYYASFLELGTKKAKARPFLRPALQEYKNQFSRTVGNDLRRRLR